MFPFLRRIAIPCILVLASVTHAAQGSIQNDVKSKTVQELADQEAIKGVTISTHGSGRDWGSDAIVGTIKDIKTLGAGWICTHPYAWIRGNGAVQFREFDASRPPAYLVRPIKEAHALGMKILIKPHLGYWGSKFRWRGAIEFKTDEQWERFFTTYEAWIVSIARACKDADGFAVATELEKTTQHVKQWRRIIAEVRKVTKSPLTMAANWTNYEGIAFWKDLDVIGIQAYFPLTKKKDASAADLRAGWSRIMKKLSRFAKAQGKDIVFTELGYNASFSAAIRPWEYRRDRGAEAVKELCMKTALEAIENEPRVLGSFLWKWFPTPSATGRNFRLATKGMRKTISSVWKTGKSEAGKAKSVAEPTKAKRQRGSAIK